MKLIHQNQLFRADNTPAMFIRYNSHTFLKHGLKQSVSATDTVQAEQAREARESRLIDTIKNAHFGAQRSLRVLYMYYNCYLPLSPVDGIHTYHLNIWLDPAYCKEILHVCMPVIV